MRSFPFFTVLVVINLASAALSPASIATAAEPDTKTTAAAPATNELDLPADKIEGGQPDRMMRRYLMPLVDQAAERWKADYEKRTKPEDIAAYQKAIRETFLKAIGGLPERTPLDPQVTGTVARPGYRVEKVIFQSRPKFFVTALFFLPDAEKFKPPYPGVIVPCGHSNIGKAYPSYQSMGALLAIHGMAALVFDPIDQGERGQYLGEGGWPKLQGTAGHSNVGMGCVLLGQNTARFEIWDGMRAIDYLLSRPEVDPKRIGCTGNSGGGTQTSYLMALDDRIICAAPSCYITSLPRLLATIGPQDAEQNIFGQLANGLDHADYVMMRAPSPVLLCTATKDFFDIAGSWDSFRSAKRLYSRLGFPERISLLENDAGHNYDTPAREGVVRWMARWLLRKDEPIKEPAITLLGEEEYRCTADGKVMTLPGARSVYDLNEDEEARLLPIREAAWKAKRLAEQQDTIRRVTGIRKIADLPKPQVESLGTIARDGCTIERLAIRPEPGITLPGLFFVPQKQDKPAGVVLYLNQRGKAVDAAAGGPIEQIVQAGNAVLAVDLRGVGQTQAVLKEGGYTGEFQDAYVAYLLGRNFVGMRAEDVLVCARYAAERAAGSQGQGGANAVRLVAVGLIGVPALHAAALEPELFQDVMLSQTLPSWASVIHGRLNKGLVMHVVHGALQCYDLPNLAAMLGDKVTIEQPVDPTGAVVHGAPK